MTRYTVVWHDDALNQLAKIWVSASDRQAITLATIATDRHLADDPGEKGIEVEGGLRQVAIPPLRLLFAVSDPDRIVKVLNAASG